MKIKRTYMLKNVRTQRILSPAIQVTPMKMSRRDLLIEEQTEGFKQGVPRTSGILALNSFGARRDQWDPPSFRFKRVATSPDELTCSSFKEISLSPRQLN